MIAYRATRGFHLGQIKHDVQIGDVLHFDGRLVRIDGKDHPIPLVTKMVTAGWLVPTDTDTHALTVAPPATVMPPKPTPPPANEVVGKQHVWDSDWLNHPNGEATCRVCGATRLGDSLIRTDRLRGNGKPMNSYRDAQGRLITTFEELSCPIWVGDADSAAAVAKEHVRRVKGRVDNVEARLTALETENALLRDGVAARQEEALTLLRQLVALASEGERIDVGSLVTRLLPEIPPPIEVEIIESEAVEVGEE